MRGAEFFYLDIVTKMKLVCLSNSMASNTKALFTFYNTLNEMKAIIYLIGLAEIVIQLESAITTSIQNVPLENVF